MDAGLLTDDGVPATTTFDSASSVDGVIVDCDTSAVAKNGATDCSGCVAWADGVATCTAIGITRRAGSGPEIINYAYASPARNTIEINTLRAGYKALHSRPSAC